MNGQKLGRYPDFFAVKILLTYCGTLSVAPKPLPIGKLENAESSAPQSAPRLKRWQRKLRYTDLRKTAGFFLYVPIVN